MKLTKRAVESAEYPYPGETKRFLLMDDGLPGFGLRIYPTGRKAFIVRYYNAQGRRRLFTIGDFGPLTVDEARKRAKRKLADVEDGDDPLEERRAARNTGTVRELCEAYMERHAKPHKKSWKDDESRIKRNVLPAWGHLPAPSVTPEDVARLHHKLGKTKPYEANRNLALIRKMFELGKVWGFVPRESANPAIGVEKFKEKSRDRWVSHDELPRLAEAIDKDKSVYVRAVLWLYLLTGMRKRELLGIRWDDVDLEAGTITLEDTKAGRSHRVPLSPPALAILKEVPRVDGNPYVFVGRRAGRPLVNIDKPWRRIRKEAGIEDVRLHDLRRTVGSWLAQSGSSLLVIQKALNHSTYTAVLAYARMGEDPVRNALDEHGHRLMVAAGKAEEGEVVAIRGK